METVLLPSVSVSILIHKQQNPPLAISVTRSVLEWFQVTLAPPKELEVDLKAAPEKVSPTPQCHHKGGLSTVVCVSPSTSWTLHSLLSWVCLHLHLVHNFTAEREFFCHGLAMYPHSNFWKGQKENLWYIQLLQRALCGLRTLQTIHKYGRVQVLINKNVMTDSSFSLFL